LTNQEACLQKFKDGWNAIIMHVHLNTCCNILYIQQRTWLRRQHTLITECNITLRNLLSASSWQHIKVAPQAHVYTRPNVASSNAAAQVPLFPGQALH
jgi:hypothetical protein